MLEPRPAVLGMKSYRSPSAGLTGLNLNMNENTAGCSPRVYRKLASLTAEEVSRYPHRDHCEELVARFLGVSPDQVVLTNGVDEGLHLVCETYLREEDEAILVVPTFGMYAIYIQATGAKIITVPMHEDFSFPIDEIIARITPRTRLIALANPNNPSGTVAESRDLLRLVESAPNAAVLIDEAYFEFYGQSVLSGISKYDNLFIARTFSKAYGLAGLRVGVLIGRANQMEMVRRVSSPYNVNAAALAALPGRAERSGLRRRLSAPGHRRPPARAAILRGKRTAPLAQPRQLCSRAHRPEISRVHSGAAAARHSGARPQLRPGLCGLRSHHHRHARAYGSTARSHDFGDP